MKKLLLILITLLALALLCGCGDEYDTPEEMQFVGGGAEKGYYFFAPEEWTVGKEMDGIDYVYVSRVDTTSVSFAEIDPESFVNLKPDPAMSDEEFFLSHYFESTKSEFPESVQYGNNNGQNYTLGSGDTKASKSVKCNFSYIVESGYTDATERVGFLQIFASHGGKFYILTYAATLNEKEEGTSTFDHYLEKLQLIIDNFRFTEASGEPEKTEYPTDSDGDILASDKKLCGFDLYVPADFEVDYSSAIVSATHKDGSNLTVTRATATGTTIEKYWEFRKSELDIYVDSITDIGTNPHAIDFSNAKNAAACEYTYVYNGKTFHVYQIFAVSGGLSQKGYIFTYTALEENFSLHLDDINRVLEKVNF